MTAKHQDGTEEGEDRIKVTDRRLFGPDGSLREPIPEPAEDEKPEPNEEAAANSSAGAGKFQHRPLEEPEGVDFTMLINAMAQPALIFLGEIPHPATGAAEVNLEQARLQIDLLTLLRIRCRGNLSGEEEGLLDRILYQLRMLYVAKSHRGGAPG